MSLPRKTSSMKVGLGTGLMNQMQSERESQFANESQNNNAALSIVPATMQKNQSLTLATTASQNDNQLIPFDTKTLQLKENLLLCPLKLKCPAEMKLAKTHQQWREREAWWVERMAKIGQKFEKKLNDFGQQSSALMKFEMQVESEKAEYEAIRFAVGKLEEKEQKERQEERERRERMKINSMHLGSGSRSGSRTGSGEEGEGNENHSGNGLQDSLTVVTSSPSEPFHETSKFQTVVKTAMVAESLKNNKQFLMAVQKGMTLTATATGKGAINKPHSHLDPTLGTLIDKTKRMRTFEDLYEYYAYECAFNVKMRYFHGWRQAMGIEGNELLAKKCNDAIEQNRILNEQLKEKNALIVVLEELNRELTERCYMGQEEIAIWWRLKEKQKDTIKQLRKRVAELEEELARTKLELKRTKEKLADRERKLAKVTKEYKDYKAKTTAEIAKLREQLEAQIRQTAYWRKQCENMRKRDQKEKNGEKKPWYLRTCDFCGEPCSHNKPCDFCGKISDEHPINWGQGWRLKLPKFWNVWKSLLRFNSTSGNSNLGGSGLGGCGGSDGVGAAKIGGTSGMGGDAHSGTFQDNWRRPKGTCDAGVANMWVLGQNLEFLFKKKGPNGGNGKGDEDSELNALGLKGSGDENDSEDENDEDDPNPNKSTAMSFIITADKEKKARKKAEEEAKRNAISFKTGLRNQESDNNFSVDGTKFGSAYGVSRGNYVNSNTKKNTMPMRIIYKTKYVYRYLMGRGKSSNDVGSNGNEEKLDPGRYEDQVSNAQTNPNGTVFMTDSSSGVLVSPVKSRRDIKNLGQNSSRISPYKARIDLVGSPKSEKKAVKHSPYKTVDVAGPQKHMDVYGMVEQTRKNKPT